MTIKKYDGVWAESGDVTPAPTTAKKALGFVGGDQPPYETFNYLNNRLDQAVTELIRERVNSFYDDAADPEGMFTTGLFDESWGCGRDDANIIDSGVATREYVEIAVYFTSTNEPRVLVLDNENLKVEVWDARTLTLLDTSDAFTDDLPSGGGETWIAESMCTDGTSVYCTFLDDHLGSPSHTYRIQAWDIATWGVKSGWAATGVAGPGAGYWVGAALMRNTKIIVANSTHLALANRYIAITASSSTAISIIAMADGSISSGAGDATTGAAEYASNGICSDGTNIYFIQSNNGTGAGALATATIADPTTGCGGTGYPLTVGTSGISYRSLLLACGPNLIVSAHDNSGTATQVVLRTHNSGTADLESIILGQDTQGTPLSGDDFIMDAPAGMCFDGINIWIYCYFVAANSLLKIDASKLHLEDPSITRQISDVASGIFNISPEGGAALRDVSVKFDGRDIWVATESGASNTNSGKIHRLPLALLRH